MSTLHLGHWLVTRMDLPGVAARWKPRAGFAVFTDDGRYRCGDLEGTDESGIWIADGPHLLTEDPSLGTVGRWQHRSGGDVLIRALSDEETGYRGAGDLVYERASADAFRSNAKRHLLQLEGLGAAAADKLLDAGIRFVGEVAGWTPETIDRLADRTGLAVDQLQRWRKAAGGW